MSPRRALPTLAAAAAALVLATSAAVAFLATADYSGEVRDDPASNIGFDIRRTDAGVRRVVNFTIFNLEMTCTDSKEPRTGGWRFDRRMRIHEDGTFSGRGDWIDLPVDPVGFVRGAMLGGGEARGQVRARGELAGPGTHCDTGRLRWDAQKEQLPSP